MEKSIGDFTEKKVWPNLLDATSVVTVVTVENVLSILMYVAVDN